MDNKKKFYSTEEVSEMLGHHIATIQRWLRSGKLEGVKVGQRWLISEEELEKKLGIK